MVNTDDYNSGEETTGIQTFRAENGEVKSFTYFL